VRILISAGEASGEMYGAELIEALRRIRPDAEFFGAGGESMRRAGCELIVDAKDLSVVGITEILGHLPKIWGLFHKLIAAADRQTPDVAIVIDSPAFNWRVAREMKKRGVPVAYYVAPQFWAWRQGRVRLLRKYVDKALVIFPFEQEFYRARGVNATFVGHPLAFIKRPEITRNAFAAQYSLDSSKPWITLMPGSRRKEVRMNLPTMLQAAAQLGSNEVLIPVAPTLEESWLKQQIGRYPVYMVPDARGALIHSRAGIIASGTATVEAALMKTPFVMVYRVSKLTYLLGKPRIKVPYFAMVNLIAGEEVVPELVQDEFTTKNVAERTREIMGDGPVRERMVNKLAKVKEMLIAGSLPHDSTPGQPSTEGSTPPERAAKEILALQHS
jgi:lipid-A-disaccharide synthase